MKLPEDVQPQITVEELLEAEEIVRKDVSSHSSLPPSFTRSLLGRGSLHNLHNDINIFTLHFRSF